MSADDLLAYLLLAPDHPLAGPLRAWLGDSRAFAAFAATYRDKIRKKIRGARDADGLRDLAFELEVAYLLVHDRRFDVVYEPAGQGKARGPDFAAEIKGSVTFNVEVTRMRPASSAHAPTPEQQRERTRERLQEVVCGKLHQMQPGGANTLVVVMDGPAFEADDLPLAMSELRLRAERNDELLLRRGDFRGPPDFFKHYQRLSAVAVRRARPAGHSYPLGMWTNSQARHALSTTLQRRLG